MKTIFRIIFIYIPINLTISLFTITYLGYKHLETISYPISRAYELGCYLGVSLDRDATSQEIYILNYKCYKARVEFHNTFRSYK